MRLLEEMMSTIEVRKLRLQTVNDTRERPTSAIIIEVKGIGKCSC